MKQLIFKYMKISLNYILGKGFQKVRYTKPYARWKLLVRSNQTKEKKMKDVLFLFSYLFFKEMYLIDMI